MIRPTPALSPGSVKIILARQSTSTRTKQLKLMKINQKIGVHANWHTRQILRIMKLTILIMTIFLLQVSASSNAQITINAKKESLRKVLEKISQQSGYDFVYSDQTINKANPVDLKLSNASIETALQGAFAGQPLIYEVSDKTVMIKRKDEKSYLETILARFQAIDVHGKVVDSLGIGIAGATVSIKNGKRSTLSTTNGDFYIKNVDEDAILVFSYLGYTTKEQTVAKEFMYVEMQMSSSKLDEVQIQAYGKTSRRISTGNITTINASEISNQPISNPIYAIIGRVAGLEITPNSGQPGAPVKIQLRGQNSLSGSQTEPLIVVDEVPFANNLSVRQGGFSALSMVNPNDIESINVLKDADATSIYGSRGANGVILITTKKGKAGETKIDGSVSFGYSSSPRKYDLLGTSEYLEMRNEALKNDGVVPSNDPYEFRPGYAYAPDLTFWDQNKETDWQKRLLGGSASYKNTNFSISGGSSLIQYIVSGTYSKQGYINPIDDRFKKDKWENGFGHFNLIGSTKDHKLRISLTGNYATNNTLNRVADFSGTALALAPNAPDIYQSNGELNWAINPENGMPTWDNPFAILNNPNELHSNTLKTNVDINYSLFKDLAAKVSFGYADLDTKDMSIITIASLSPSTFNPEGRTEHRFSSNSSLTVDPQIGYKRNLSNGKLDVLTGITLQNQSFEYAQLNALGYKDDLLLKDIKSAGRITANNTTSQYKYFGIYGRLTYNWLDRYILNLNGRRDGSSRFGSGNQYGNFWSVGSAWVFTNEHNLKEVLPFLSYGKLRASYGSSGNDGVGDYKYLDLYDVYESSWYQGIKPIKSFGAYNPNYHWEDTHKMEIASEWGFFKDRIYFSAAYWRTRSSNQLGGYPLPKTAGADGITINQEAKIQNSGWEIILNTKNLESRLHWTTSFNLGWQRNKILALPSTFNTATIDAIRAYKDRGEDPIGKPFSGILGVYEFMGVNAETGRYQFKEKDGGIGVDGFEYSKLVDINPKFNGGIANSFIYKGISLEVFFQFTKQISKNSIGDVMPGFFNQNQPIQVMQRWRNIGDISNFQRFSNGNFDYFQSNYRKQLQSDQAYSDGSYIRLNNLSISYDISPKLFSRIGLRTARLNVSGQNILTITNFGGGDVQVENYYRMPIQRTWTFGFSLGI
ncbi:MAG: SusC/RagA family TonB-linked outer membrane protein [Janthinobacterium sp.]|jgi:TonB-linked SusC/RagA family outer membrane protein